MLSWTDLIDRFQKHTKTTDSTTQTLGESWMNYAHQKLVKLGNYAFTEYQHTIDSLSSTYQYTLPPRYGKMKNVTQIDSGSNRTPLTEVQNWADWQALKTSQVTSSECTHWMVVKGAAGNTQWQLWVWPTPTVTTLDFECTFTTLVPKLSVTDYTTGTLTATNASTTITGAGTTFTAAMAGRSIYLPDGFWYDIAARVSNTEITLASKYQGTTEAGAAVRIGQVPLVPEAYQDAIWGYAVGMYWAKERQLEDSAYYMGLYTDVVAEIEADQKSKSTEQVFRDDDIAARTINQYPIGPL